MWHLCGRSRKNGYLLLVATTLAEQDVVLGLSVDFNVRKLGEQERTSVIEPPTARLRTPRDSVPISIRGIRRIRWQESAGCANWIQLDSRARCCRLNAANGVARLVPAGCADVICTGKIVLAVISNRCRRIGCVTPLGSVQPSTGMRRSRSARHTHSIWHGGAVDAGCLREVDRASDGLLAALPVPGRVGPHEDVHCTRSFSVFNS